MTAKMLYVHALSPIHTGVGQSAGLIDLPVAREKHTGYPYLPGSSLKGVLRAASDEKSLHFKPAFGPEPKDVIPTSNAGALQFTNARLFALPVRSFYGTFAWVTCRDVLMAWQSDYRSAGLKNDLAIPPPPALAHIRLTPLGALANGGPTVYLEDLDLTVDNDGADGPLGKIAKAVAAVLFDDADWRTRFVERFALISDTLFNHFSTVAMETTTRVRIAEKTKTVASGALWREEAIPTESLFSCPLGFEKRNGADETGVMALAGEAATNARQIGGKASVGRGLIRVRLAGEIAP